MSNTDKNPLMGVLALIGMASAFMFVVNLPSSRFELYPLPEDATVTKSGLSGFYRSWRFGEKREFLLIWWNDYWLFSWLENGTPKTMTRELPSFLERREVKIDNFKAPYSDPW